MEAPTLSALPDSLLLRILALLPLRDRLRGARVCRRWQCVVQDKLLWRHVNLTRYKMSSKVLWHLLQNYLQGNLRTLRARGSLPSVRKQEVFSPALMQALGMQCPDLHHLCLSKANLRSLSYDCLPPSLMTLELHRCCFSLAWFKEPGFSQTPQAFPCIQHLIIHRVSGFRDVDLLTIARRVPLKTLVLSHVFEVTDHGTEKSLEYLPELESLTLHNCRIHSVPRFIGRYLKHLRLLDLNGNFTLPEKCLPHLSGLVSLEALRLNDCFRLSPETIATICQALPRLKKKKKREKKSLDLYPALHRSLRAAYNLLAPLPPQQTPCEMGGAETALKRTALRIACG